ncbi:phage tail protein [Ectobacillus sp. JY-23]|uniref:phage tail protein n=1 Tax=Ectobacillus sp. JY-23 TaxID=2933872 RepID=UPI001FF61D39|nr:phage tail protein [Ectobacillus sp. JY-23]UOY92904.1 phage tail protein [Ectobacillus sp. JY-23]
MNQLFLFDGLTEKLVAVSSNDGNMMPFYDDKHVEQLNRDFTFTFSVPATHADAIYVKRGNIAGFLDLDGNLQAFTIYNTEEFHDGDTFTKTASCEHVSYELLDDIVEDKRTVNGTALQAVTDALSKSRWQIGTVDSLGTNNVNFYYNNALNNLREIVRVYGGELRFRLTYTAGSITGRYVDLLTRRGVDTGKRFEYTKDLTSVKRTEDFADVKTALYGRGKSSTIEATGGYTRKATFRDVVWTTVGNPANKPAGQEWVGDTNALALYGRANGTRHRYGVVEFNDIEDPNVLLQATWDFLQTVNKPRLTYEVQAVDLERVAGLSHEKSRLGDNVFVIDKDFTPELRVQARVIEVRRSLTDPAATEFVLGNFIPMLTDITSRIEGIEQTINDRGGVWDGVVNPIDDGDVAPVTATTPTNFTANGLFELIALKWDFDSRLGLAGYEVYGSQVNNFTPQASNLIWKGKAGGITHKANPNETWYFRLRSFNTAGQYSAYTAQVTASTTKINGTYIADATIGNAQIGNVSADKLTAGTIDAVEIDIVNINADNINTGLLSADRVRIGAGTTFENGYNPVEMVIGSANMLKGWDFSRFNVNDWQVWNANTQAPTVLNITLNSGEVLPFLKVASNAGLAKDSTFGLGTKSSATGLKFTVIGGEKYTLSFLVARHPNATDDLNYTYLINDGGTNQRIPTTSVNIQRVYGGITSPHILPVYRYELTFTATETCPTVRLLIGARTSSDFTGTNAFGVFYVAKIKLEQGTKATAWTPNNEEIVGELTDTSGKINAVVTSENSATVIDGNKVATGSIDANKLKVTAFNLINNPTMTETVTDWVASAGTITLADNPLTTAGGGVSSAVKVAKLSSTGNGAFNSNLFLVDPNKAYKFKVALYKPTGQGGRSYFGIVAYDKDLVQLTCDYFNVSTRTLSGSASFPYFWFSNTGNTDQTNGVWRYMEGYALGPDANVDNYPNGKNVDRHVKLPPNTRYILVRVLNYANTVNSDLYMYSPSVTVADSGKISFDQAEGGKLKLGQAYGNGELEVYADTDGDGQQELVGQVNEKGISGPTITSNDFRGNVVNVYQGGHTAIYVDGTNGNDANDGSTMALAKKNLFNVINGLPKNLNGRNITIWISNIKLYGGMHINGFQNGQLLIAGYNAQKSTIVGYTRISGSTTRVLFQDIIFEGDNTTVGKALVDVFLCTNVELYACKLYGFNKAQHGIYYDRASGVVGETHVYGVADRGIYVTYGRVDVYNNYGNAPVAFLADTGGHISGFGTRWGGTLSRTNSGMLGYHSYTDNTWKQDVWTVNLGEATPAVPPEQTTVWNSTFGGNYSSQGFFTANEVKQGDYGYGNRKGLWVFGNIRGTLAGKTIVSAKLTITRDSRGGASGGRTAHIVCHAQTANPNGDFAVTGEVASGVLGWGQTLVIDVTSATQTQIANGTQQGFGVYIPSGGSTDYMSLSTSASLQVTYR